MAAFAALGSVATASGAASTGATVDLHGCVESIYAALVPIASASKLVPTHYTLVGEPGPVTPIIVRTSHCNSLTDGNINTGPLSLAQIGALVVSPDGTGDVNVYQFWYYTNSLLLARALSASAMPAQFVPTFGFNYRSCSNALGCPLRVTVPPPAGPTFSEAGTVTTPSMPTGPFIANWWHDDAGKTVKLESDAPDVTQGVSQLAVHTDPDNALGRLFGRS